jgi:hypothetical protein
MLKDDLIKLLQNIDGNLRVFAVHRHYGVGTHDVSSVYEDYVKEGDYEGGALIDERGRVICIYLD